jgi:hypothetical protein
MRSRSQSRTKQCLGRTKERRKEIKYSQGRTKDEIRILEFQHRGSQKNNYEVKSLGGRR